MNCNIEVLEVKGTQRYSILGEPLAFYVREAANSVCHTGGEHTLVIRNDVALIRAVTVERALNLCLTAVKDKGFDVIACRPLFFFMKTDLYEKLRATWKKNGFKSFRKAVYESGQSVKTLDKFIEPLSKKDKFTVSDGAKLAYAAKIIKKRIIKNHIKNGARFADTAGVFIGPKARIGIGALIKQGAVIEGETFIGENCQIGPYTQLCDVTVGAQTEVCFTVARESQIGQNCQIGPFAYIRPGSKIADRVKIGDFVEVKNSSVGEGSKASHLTYIGDAEIGSGVNIGCGVITANYDGVKKHKTVVEDGAFIGSNVNLVAPVTIGKNAFLAAGGTITKDVPQDALAVARARQSIKPEWRK